MNEDEAKSRFLEVTGAKEDVIRDVIVTNSVADPDDYLSENGSSVVILSNESDFSLQQGNGFKEVLKEKGCTDPCFAVRLGRNMILCAYKLDLSCLQ